MNRMPGKDMDKKRRLFEAATHLFAQKGFEKTTVDEIAEAAEVAKGTVYYYFKGKEELFFFLVEEGIDILKQRLSTVLTEEKDIRRCLQRMMETQLKFFEEYQDVCRMVLAEAWGMSPRQEKLQQLLNEYYAVVGAIISKAINQGVVHAYNSEVITAAFFGMTVIPALHFLRRDEPINWDIIQQQVEQLFFAGAVRPGQSS